MQARWLFVLAPRNANDESTPFALYMPMLDEFVEIAARFGAAHGATSLDVRRAQRTLTVDRTLEQRALDRGLVRSAGQNEEGLMIKGVSAADVRVTLEALAQEGPYPRLASVQVVSAAAEAAHPGLAYAEFGCNYVLRRLRGQDDAWPEVDDRLFVFERSAVAALRGIARAMRSRPSELVRAARHLEELRGHAMSSPESWSLATRGSATVGLEAVHDPVAVAEALPADSSKRFAIDMLLRALLWAPQAVASEVRQSYEKRLRGAKTVRCASV